MIKVEIDRVHGDFGFEAKDANGNLIRLDSSPESGGQNFGFRPMQLLLAGLGGCSGIDIVSILKKQRQEVESFHMQIEGEREADKEPSLWEDVTITFVLKGNIDEAKAKRACELSMEKYCSVAQTLRLAGCNLRWELQVIA